MGPESDGLSRPTARAWFIAVPGASPRPTGLEQVSGSQLPSLPFNQASSCPGPCPLWPLPNARNGPCPGKYRCLSDLCLVRKKVAQCGRRIRPWGHVVLSPQLCSIHLCHWETQFPLHCPGGDASVSKYTPKGPLNTELLPCRLRFKWCLEWGGGTSLPLSRRLLLASRSTGRSCPAAGSIPTGGRAPTAVTLYVALSLLREREPWQRQSVGSMRLTCLRLRPSRRLPEGAAAPTFPHAPLCNVLMRNEGTTPGKWS